MERNAANCGAQERACADAPNRQIPGKSTGRNPMLWSVVRTKGKPKSRAASRMKGWRVRIDVGRFQRSSLTATGFIFSTGTVMTSSRLVGAGIGAVAYMVPMISSERT
jgi:hypothetical protein